MPLVKAQAFYHSGKSKQAPVAESLRVPPAMQGREPWPVTPKSVDYARGNVCLWRTELLHDWSSGPLNAYTGPGTDLRSRLNVLKLY